MSPPNSCHLKAACAVYSEIGERDGPPRIGRDIAVIAPDIAAFAVEHSDRQLPRAVYCPVEPDFVPLPHAASSRPKHATAPSHLSCFSMLLFDAASSSWPAQAGSIGGGDSVHGC